METIKTQSQVNAETATLFKSHVNIQGKSIPDALSEAVNLFVEYGEIIELERPLRYFQIEIPYEVWGKMTATIKRLKTLSGVAWNTAMILFIKKYER